MSYTEFIERELKEAAALAKKMFGHVSETIKGGDQNQVLTEADLAVGKLLVEAVKRAYPEHNIIDEEAGVVDRSSKFTWVIDPIDGTSNFAAGAPHWGIMIGLLEDATPIAGGMVMPMLGLTYLAERGKGATRNGKPISVTAEPKLSNVLVRYAMDAHPDQVGRVERECADLARITNAVRNVRNSGCDPCDGGYVAGGQYGATLNRTCKIWDCVAPQIVIEEAGGLFTAFDGSPMDYSQPLAKVEHEYNTCAASPVLHEQLQKIIHAAPVA